MAGLIADAVTAAIVRGDAKPRPSVWAEQNVRLGRGMTSDPGMYSVAKTPYTEEVMDFLLDPRYDELWVQKSSRPGFTEAGLNILRYMPSFWPGNALYAIDSVDEMRNVTEKRLLPTLMQTSELDAGDTRQKAYSFPHMTMFFAGGGAAGAFENKQLRFAFGDEYDEMPLNRQKGVDVGSLLRQRLKDTDDGKMLIMGKPTLGPNGPLARSVALGTMDRYFCVCPKCGEEQALEWERVRFSHCRKRSGEWDLERVLAETYYECAGEEKCRLTWEEHQRPMMAKANGAGWRPTNPSPTPRRRSMIIGDLYSPFSKASWPRMAMEWASYSGSPEKRANFRIHSLGEVDAPATRGVKMAAWEGLRIGAPWFESDGEEEALWGDHLEPYDLVQSDQTVLPFAPDLVISGADRQGDCHKFLIIACRRGERADDIALADYGETGLADHEILGVLERRYRAAGEEEAVGVTGMFVDSGHDTDAVYGLSLTAQDEGLMVRASMGMSGAQVKGLYEERDAEHSSGRLVKRWDYKDLALTTMIIEGGVYQRRSPRIFMPENIGEHKGLLAELANNVRVTRGLTDQWTRATDEIPNDWFDCLKVAYLYWLVARLHL